MPAHSFARDDFEAGIRRLEQTGHRIVQVVADGDGAFLVITEQVKERRGKADVEDRTA